MFVSAACFAAFIALLFEVRAWATRVRAKNASVFRFAASLRSASRSAANADATAYPRRAKSTCAPIVSRKRSISLLVFAFSSSSAAFVIRDSSAAASASSAAAVRRAVSVSAFSETDASSVSSASRAESAAANRRSSVSRVDFASSSAARVSIASAAADAAALCASSRRSSSVAARFSQSSSEQRTATRLFSASAAFAAASAAAASAASRDAFACALASTRAFADWCLARDATSRASASRLETPAFRVSSSASFERAERVAARRRLASEK